MQYILLALFVEFFNPRFVAALWHPALLVKQVQHPQLGLDEINAGLIVVKVDHLPLDPLLHVLLLLQLEHVHVELLLQLLVGIVDAKLLKTVLPEDFKAVDVKNSNYCGIGDIRLRKYIRSKRTTELLSKTRKTVL